MTPSNTSAIILAAGKGTRLKKIGEKVPKCLLQINKKSLLHYQLTSLQKNGIEKIFIVVGFKKQLIIDYCKKHFPGLDISFVTNKKFKTTNTLYSLFLASEKITKPDRILLLNGDVFFDQEITRLLVSCNDTKNYICIQSKKCGKEEVKFTLNKDKSIKELNKKILPEHALGEAVGINLFSQSFFTALKKELVSLKNLYPKEYFEFALENMLRKQYALYPFDIGSRLTIEIDYLADLYKARRISK